MTTVARTAWHLGTNFSRRGAFDDGQAQSRHSEGGGECRDSLTDMMRCRTEPKSVPSSSAGRFFVLWALFVPARNGTWKSPCLKPPAHLNSQTRVLRLVVTRAMLCPCPDIVAEDAFVMYSDTCPAFHPRSRRYSWPPSLHLQHSEHTRRVAETHSHS